MPGIKQVTAGIEPVNVLLKILRKIDIPTSLVHHFTFSSFRLFS
jgi:hypothetical protein